jgi:DNA-binding transcriptional regulator YhcF (GntR family)
MDSSNHSSGEKAQREHSTSSKLSYKFQRLREKLRLAISSGELNGKLPGERQLAKRFHVNAKTLSKALTDLAAEGLLDRSIGRGTFVKGSGIAASSTGDRWMVLCDPDQTNSAIIEYLKQMNDNIHVVSDITTLRPSFLNPIKAVIDLATNTPDAFLRDLVVRNMTVVLVGREPTTYSVNAVVVDRALGGAYLAREMMMIGHRHFVVVERRGQTVLADAVRRAAQRYAPEATVDSVYATDVTGSIQQQGATAVICDTRKSASQVRAALEEHNISIPARVSLAAIGSGWGDYPCSGYFLHSQQKAEAAVELIRNNQAKRPTTLWLTGASVDGGTIAPPPPTLTIPGMEHLQVHHLKSAAV